MNLILDEFVGNGGVEENSGILKRDGKVNLVKNCSKSELLPIIEGKVLEGLFIPMDLTMG